MRVLVTGATGFLGRATVRAALAAGHEVVALHRPNSPPTADAFTTALHWVAGDLREPGEWCEALTGVEGVIHCAAAASGDLSTQLAGTVLATENLLACLPSGLQRIVHVSSMSVYDFDKPRIFGLVSEQTPVELAPGRRDAYTQTKLLQERLVRQFAAQRQVPLVVARPGAIYGAGKTWEFGRTLGLGRCDLIFAPLTRMRLIFVDNCAGALVAGLTCPVENELIVNLVDTEQPTHWRFHKLARRAGAPVGMRVPVPYSLVLALGLAARVASMCFFKGRARLPELLDLPRQRVRWRPLRYTRARAEALLSERDQVSLLAGIAAMIGPQTPSGKHEAADR